MPSDRHHVVSRGLQRFFAEGERLLLIDKQTRRYRQVGTRDAFVERNFNSWYTASGKDDRLESQWQELENHALPRVRQLIDGQRGPEQREAAKALAAMHFARSYAYIEAHMRISEEVVQQRGAALEADPRLISSFTEQFGRIPEEGKIATLAASKMEQLRQQRLLRVNGMRNCYNAAIKLFQPLHVQLFIVRGPVELVIGDNPVITTNDTWTKLGLREGLALGDSQGVYMPLGRRLGMTLLSQASAPDLKIPPNVVQNLNWLVWRSAKRFIACHPSTNPSRLLAGTPIVEDVRKPDSRQEAS